MRYTVFDFAGTGGVALAMYNTDTVCICFTTTLFYAERKCYHIYSHISHPVYKPTPIPVAQI